MTSRLKSRPSGFATFFRKTNRGDTEETKQKAEELQVAKKYYKNSQAAARELSKAGQALGEAETAMGTLLRQFIAEGVSNTSRSVDLRHLCEGFSERLKKLASLRSQVSEKLESEYVPQLQRVLDDDRMKEARSKRQIPAELEYQLARRDYDVAEAVRVMAYSYLCYFETGAALMREMETMLKDMEQKHVQRSSIDRKDFIDAQSGGSGGSDAPLQAAVATDDTKVFAVPLHVILERPDEPGPIPVIMHEVIEFIEANYMGREGIFRVPGAASEVKRLKERIDAGQKIDWSGEPIVNKEHTICAVVKAFIRDLPEPLLTFQKFDEFVLMTKLTDKDEQKTKLHELVNGLPQENFNLLGRLIQMFKKVVDNQAETKMNSQNIAISFGMNLMRMEVEDPMKLATSTTAINKTCELLINNCEQLFPDRITLNEASDQDEAFDESLMGWQEFYDETHKKFYYYNPTTGETSWNDPREISSVGGFQAAPPLSNGDPQESSPSSTAEQDAT